LAAWGVPWPPPKGWRKRIREGGMSESVWARLRDEADETMTPNLLREAADRGEELERVLRGVLAAIAMPEVEIKMLPRADNQWGAAIADARAVLGKNSGTAKAS
jgi:hypothetical protein